MRAAVVFFRAVVVRAAVFFRALAFLGAVVFLRAVAFFRVVVFFLAVAVFCRAVVFLRADDAVPYGEVVRTMAAIKAAGIEDVGMVTEMPAGSQDAAGARSRSKRGSPGP